MPSRIADIEIPDTTLVAEATELVRDAANPLIFRHVGAMFHDLGLTEKYRRTGQRFEIDGADEARRFLLGHGIAEDAATTVWTVSGVRSRPWPLIGGFRLRVRTR